MMLACHVAQKRVPPRRTDHRADRSANVRRKTASDGRSQTRDARESASPRSLKLTRQRRRTMAPALKRKPIQVAFERKGDEPFMGRFSVFDSGSSATPQVPYHGTI